MKYEKGAIVATLKEEYEDDHGRMCDVDVYFEELLPLVQSDLARVAGLERELEGMRMSRDYHEKREVEFEAKAEAWEKLKTLLLTERCMTRDTPEGKGWKLALDMIESRMSELEAEGTREPHS